jgi:hypothetical protein
MLYDATGYTPSQVTAKPVCAAASPGYASCDAAALVTKSGHLPVRPLTSPSSPSVSQSPQNTALTVQLGGPVLFSPQFLQQAYDTGWLSANSGVGKTVAIVDANGDPNPASDVDAFRSGYNLPAISHSACTPSNIAGHTSGPPCMVVANQTGGSSLPPPAGGWDVEESLDLDAVSAMCPNCNILLIETDSAADSDLGAGDAEALSLGAKLLSNSWGAPESGSTDADYFTGTEEATGAAAGSETFVSTGDNGAYVDGGYSNPPDQAPYPASEEYFTAVGGTSLDHSTGARGINELAWSGAGSACSTQETQPTWQTSAGTGCSGRATSDVSADADPETGLNVYDSNAGGWGIYGGTSLAAPLAAAYAALTSVNSGSTTDSHGMLSAEWAYANASKLNDITSGSNGTHCSSSLSYAMPQICNAGTGWDGPTGVGSISGDVVTSGVGPSLTVPPAGGVGNGTYGYSIIQSVSDASATFDGGVYPNGSATTVSWEYGTAAATGSGTNFTSATPVGSQNVGSGTTPVLATPATVSGLIDGTVYYVEECASNSTGTICGNVSHFTAEARPVATGLATLADNGLDKGDQISLATQPSWSPSPTSVSYQWQESSDGQSWSNVGNATSSPSTYTIALADSERHIRMAITATDDAGATTAYSNSVQVDEFAPAASGNLAIAAADLGLGGVISIASSPTWAPGSPTVTDQWQRSSDDIGWANIGGATGSSYTIQASDSQQYIRVAMTAADAVGTTTVYSSAVQVNDLAAPGTVANAPRLSGTSSVGGTISVGGGSYSGGGVTVTFQRCARACTTVQSGSSTSYTLQAADAGYFIVASVSVAGIDGGSSASATAGGLIGPIVSPLAGALKIAGRSATLRSGSHAALVSVKRTIVRPRSKKSKASTYVLALTRAFRGKGTLKAWSCVLAQAKIVSCTGVVSVSHAAKLSESVRNGDTVELIAVR